MVEDGVWHEVRAGLALRGASGWTADWGFAPQIGQKWKLVIQETYTAQGPDKDQPIVVPPVIGQIRFFGKIPGTPGLPYERVLSRHRTPVVSPAGAMGEAIAALSTASTMSIQTGKWSEKVDSSEFQVEWCQIMTMADQLEKDIEVYQRTAELTQCNATLTRVYDAVNDWSALGLHCIEPGGALWSLPWETPSVQALLDCCASTLEPYSFCSPYSANIEHSYPVWLDCLCRECESPIRAPQVLGEPSRGVGLCLYPSFRASVTFETRGRFGMFSAMTSVEERDSPALSNCQLMWELIGDGQLLWSHHGNDMNLCRVSIEGVQKLQLVTWEATQQLHERVHVSWLNATTFVSASPGSEAEVTNSEAGSHVMGDQAQDVEVSSRTRSNTLELPSPLVEYSEHVVASLQALVAALRKYALLFATPSEMTLLHHFGVTWQEARCASVATSSQGIEAASRFLMGQETILSSVMENTVAEEGAASHTNIKLDKLGNLTCIAGTNPERTIHASQATIRSFAGGEIYIGIPEMKYVDMDTGKRVMHSKEQLVLQVGDSTSPVKDLLGKRLLGSLCQQAWVAALQHAGAQFDDVEACVEHVLAAATELEDTSTQYLECSATAGLSEQQDVLDGLRAVLRRHADGTVSSRSLFVRVQREDETAEQQAATPFITCTCWGAEGALMIQSDEGDWNHQLHLNASVSIVYSVKSNPCMLLVSGEPVETRQRLEFRFYHPQPEYVRWLASSLVAHQVTYKSTPQGALTSEQVLALATNPATPRSLRSSIESNESERSPAMGSLVAALCSFAHNTGQSFSNGTFILVSEKSAEGLWQAMKSDPKSYRRVSSHLKKLPGGQPKQWGCDVPEFDIFAAVRRTKQEAKKTIRTVLFSDLKLPTDTRQSAYQKPCIFIKPESHGTQGWSDTLHHGIDYIATRPLIARNFGDPESKVERKERVPDWSIALFEEACVALGTQAIPEAQRKKAPKIGICHMLSTVESADSVDPEADLVFEMQLQIARHLVEQNSLWWTHHPNSVFFEDHELDKLKDMIQNEHGFRYRLGNEVLISGGLAVSLERAFKVVQRTKLNGGWNLASEAIPEFLQGLSLSDGFSCHGVVLEALVRLFLPQEQLMRQSFEQYLGPKMDQSMMNLCKELKEDMLEPLLQESLQAIRAIENKQKSEKEIGQMDLRVMLEAMCAAGQEYESEAKLNTIRKSTYAVLSHLVQYHFTDFLKRADDLFKS